MGSAASLPAICDSFFPPPSGFPATPNNLGEKVRSQKIQRERESQNVSRAERLSYFVEEKSEGKSESERRFTQNLRTSAALKT